MRACLFLCDNPRYVYAYAFSGLGTHHLSFFLVEDLELVGHLPTEDMKSCQTVRHVKMQACGT